MWKCKNTDTLLGYRHVAIFPVITRKLSRIARPPPAAAEPVIRVTNNVAHLGSPREGPKPRQLLSLPPFPGHPLPGRNNKNNNNSSGNSGSGRVTAITWLKYYFDEIDDSVIRSHFNKGLVSLESPGMDGKVKHGRRVNPGEVMEKGMRVRVPVSVAESRISKKFDTIPCGTLYPNADEIEYLQRLVKYKDSAILVLNKPPRLPVKGNMPVHNSMDALAAAALSYGYDAGPKLVHRLDRETSGLLLMGRTEESMALLQLLFSDLRKAKSQCKDWDDACEAAYQRYWALVIGHPKESEGLIHAPISKVLLDDGKTERVVLAQRSGLVVAQEAVTEYRLLGPMINGCSWIELRPLTGRKHQLRVHCAEALGTPIVGDYKYGWFMHKKWKQIPQVDFEPFSGKPYKLRRPAGLNVQKGSVLSKVPLLHLHCRELVLPNIAKFIPILDQMSENLHPAAGEKPDILRFVAGMPSHMKISWNLMSSYLV